MQKHVHEHTHIHTYTHIHTHVISRHTHPDAHDRYSFKHSCDIEVNIYCTFVCMSVHMDACTYTLHVSGISNNLNELLFLMTVTELW